jgi:glycosyltransferase involved in cell wall biosynthesis
MRVCLIGDFTKNRDEGLKNITQYLAHEVAKRNEVFKANIKHLFSAHDLLELKRFKPEIIHYIHGPTLKSFLVARSIARINSAKVVMSAPQPWISGLSQRFIPYVKPDVILVQSRSSEHLFQSLNIRTEFIQNGVDTDKFTPVTEQKKHELREKYGIDPEKHVFLHVGHLMPSRNLEVLTTIRDPGIQFLIIASSYLECDPRIHRTLADYGCIIKTGYFPNIEEFYQLSDGYLFPLIRGNTVLTPLSVLEAMACNLHIITSRFEGLVDMFPEGNGLFFTDHSDEIPQICRELVENHTPSSTRSLVLPYSWHSVAERVQGVYETLSPGG